MVFGAFLFDSWLLTKIEARRNPKNECVYCYRPKKETEPGKRLKILLKYHKGPIPKSFYINFPYK